MTFTQAGENQYPTAAANTADTVRSRGGAAIPPIIEQFIEGFEL